MTAEPTSSSLPVLSAIVVSYNTRALTLDCLHTLTARLEGIPAEILVVDNASTDGTPAALAAAFPAVRLFANAANLGFGAANNLALRHARGRYFLLLNSDAFPHPGCLPTLVHCLDTHPAVGLVAPRLVHADGTPQRSVWPFPSPVRTWLDAFWLSRLLARHPALGDDGRQPPATDRAVNFAAGACLLLRREAWDVVGPFDERFFMYQEETDWQLRARRAGWPAMFTPAAVVTHLGGTSGGEDGVRVNPVFFESLDRYLLKHHGPLGFWSNRAAQVLAAALRVAAWTVASVFPSLRPRARHELRRQARYLGRHLTTGLPPASPPRP